MSPSSAAERDNWERLMAAVLKREQFRQLCYEESRSPSISTISSDLISDQISNKSLQHISPSPSQATLMLLDLLDRSCFLLGFEEGNRRANIWSTFLVRRFSLHELKVATENFSCRIESGDGHNMVYRGRLANGSLVSVKKCENRGDQIAELQIGKVVEINGIASHPNVLGLLGFCITPKERLLVYPRMANGCVASWLRGRHELLPPLNWAMRKRIALGAARGLAYLHYECDKKIIHRGIKATNILLDEYFEAVVADFELGLIMDHNFAPEYCSTFSCIEKIDVLGSGMFLLELVIGQRVSDLALFSIYEEMAPLDWVKRKYKERKWKMVVDADGGSDDIDEVVELLVQIALVCTQSTPERRPKMSDVVAILEGGDGLTERLEEMNKNEAESETIHRTTQPRIIV